MKEDFHNQMKILINSIDLKKINISLIKTNIKKLLNIYNKLKKNWVCIDIEQIKYEQIDKKNSQYNIIIKLLKKNFLSANSNINQIITNSKYIHCLSYSNIYFYWLSNEIINKDDNYLLSIDMLKISICLNMHKFVSDNIPRYIIWIPINKKRNFPFKKINKKNLNTSNINYEAFVASGVTFGLNPKITIITRYEEIEKLLIHELVHNYNMDGSEFHNSLNEQLEIYKNIKNIKNYHYEYSMYESYTELLSTYFYLLFVNIREELKNNNVETNNKLENKLMGQILIEIIYSYNLICNLIKLNGYSNYAEFRSNIFFKGDICKYEYYYVKALMYNNFILKFGNEQSDFIDIYTSLIKMIEKINNSDDKLLEKMYDHCVKQDNFKYQMC